MYQNILVPLDGSKVAEEVLPYVKFLGAALQLPINLLHVNDLETAAPSAHAMPGADYLKAVAARLPTSLAVNCFEENGRAAEVIIDRASRDPTTLITMATHGRSGGQRWLAGSVAQKVIQAATNPLLIIRPKKQTRLRSDVRLSTVILPLDGSLLAEKILPYVVDLATRLKLEVVLMRTYTLPTTGYFMAAGVSSPNIDAMKAKISQEVTDYLQVKVGELQAQGIAKVSSIAMEGRGPEEIIDLARRTTDSIVAMSTHGRSGIGRWVLGSVTDRVVCYCGDPVLVIRPASS